MTNLPNVPAPVAEAPRVFLEKLALDLKEKIDGGVDYAEFLRKEIMERSQDEREALVNMIERDIDIPQPMQELFTNLPELKEKILETTKEQLKSLKDSTSSITKPLFENVKDNLASVTDKVLPAKWTNEMSRDHKATVAAVATVGVAVGAVLIYRGIRNVFNRGKNAAAAGQEAASSSKGLLWKIVAAVGVGGLAFFAGKKIAEKFMKDKFKAEADAAKEKLKELADKVEDLEFSGEPWKEYDLSETDFKKADEIFRKSSAEERGKDIPEIRELFGDSPDSGKKNEELMKFLRQKYEIKEVEGHTYSRADVAVHNYQQNMEVMASNLLTWVENHAAEVIAGTYLAYRLNVLKGLLTVGQMTSGRLIEIANAMRKWGMKHPIISLCLMGGTLIGAKSVLTAKKNGQLAFIPQNIAELTNVCSSNGALVLGTFEEETVQSLESIKKLAAEVGSIGSDFGAWVISNMTDFAKKFDETTSEAIGLTEEEVIIGRNSDCLEALQQELANRRITAGTYGADQADMIKKYEAAEKDLEAYHIIFSRNASLSSVGEIQQTECLVAYEKLKAALNEVGITLKITKDVVTWENTYGEIVDLSVSPSVTDKKRLLELSEELRHGESDGTYIISRIIQHIRELEQDGSEKWKPLLSSKGIGMVLGNFVYFVEFDVKKGFIDWENVKNYGKALVYPIKDLVDSEKTWTDWGATVATASVDTAFFSLNAAVLGKLRRCVIGGGPLLHKRSWMEFKALNIVPGVAHRNVIRGIKQGINDGKIIMRFGLEGRRINTIFGRARVRPEWIPIIEYGTEAEVKNIASWLRIEEPKGTLAEMRADVRKEFIEERLAKVQIADDPFVKGLKDLGQKKRIAEENAAKLYDAVLEGFDKKVDPSIVSELSWESALRRFPNGVRSGDVQAFLELAAEEKLIDLDAKTLHLIGESPSARKIIAGALESADVKEVTRALNAAKGAAAMRGVINVGGAAADVFGIYMAYADWKANGERIEATNNPALKELYEDANTIYAVQGGSSAAGLAIGGYAIISTYIGTKSVLAAVGAAGGTIMLPVGVAVGAGAYSYKKIEAATETWLKDENDWKKEEAATLRAKIRSMGPGKQGYWQQSARGSRASVWWRQATSGTEEYKQWEEKQTQMIEDANEQTRFYMTKAYLAHTTYLPKSEGESDTDYEARLARNQSDQLRYIMVNSDNSMDVMTPVYEHAQTHAELMEMSRELKKAGRSEMITIQRSNADGKIESVEFDLAKYDELYPNDILTAGYVLAEYERLGQEQKVAQFNIIHQLCGGTNARNIIDSTIQRSMLLDVRHYLITAETNVRSAVIYTETTDPFTGANVPAEVGDRGKAQVRYILSHELRHELRNQSDRLQQLGEKAEPADYQQALERLRVVLLTKPEEYFVKGEKEEWPEQTVESTSMNLDFNWLIENLFVYPPAEGNNQNVEQVAEAA